MSLEGNLLGEEWPYLPDVVANKSAHAVATMLAAQDSWWLKVTPRFLAIRPGDTTVSNVNGEITDTRSIP